MERSTLEKMSECLESAKSRIQKIEMKATADNVSAVAEAINLIQIVNNTVIIALRDGDFNKEEVHEDGAESDAE